MTTIFRTPLLFAIALFLVSGCSSQGAKRLPADRFDYNAALGNSAREQMLMNIVRSRYQEMPVFLEVGSVVAQYSYVKSASAGYFREFINNPKAPTSDTASIGVNASYSEFPTITYQPIQGEAFARHLYSEVPAAHFFSAAQAGFSIDLLMLIGMQRIGAVKNMSFGENRSRMQRESDVSKLEKFSRTIELFYVLSDEQVVEVQQVKGDKKKGTETEQYLVINDEISEQLQPLLAEFRQLIGINHNGRFQLTERSAKLEENEITVQARSVMAMIKFLARGVEIPAAHFEQGWVVDFGLQTLEGAERLFPFRVRSSKDLPNNAFAAVRHEDYWFFIGQDDVTSKRSLEHLMILFQLKAPVADNATPLLTLPSR